MRVRFVFLVLLLLCAVSVALFGVVRQYARHNAPGPYASAPVLRAPARKTAPHKPVRVPSVVAAAPLPGALAAVPRRDTLVQDLAAVLVAAYQPADPCAESGQSGVLRISARELVKRYAPALAKSPETNLRLHVTPPLLRMGFLLGSETFSRAVRTQAGNAVRYCPARGTSRKLSAYEADEILVLIAAWLRDLAVCSRSSASRPDCVYAWKLARNLLAEERTREQVLATAEELLGRLAGKIERNVEKAGG